MPRRKRRLNRKPAAAPKRVPLAQRRIPRGPDGFLILPRLKGAKHGGVLGAEYYGCSGTLRRAKIVYCKYSERYLVGRESAFYADLRIKAIGFKGRILRVGRETLYVFKSRGAAVAKFNELDGEVLKFNRETSEAHARDIAAARGGDMAAALRLGDY